MRHYLAILPMLTMLSACVDFPDKGKRSGVRQSGSGFYSASPSARQCLSRLSTTRASFTPVPDRYFDRGCSTLNSVRLSSLRSDKAQLTLSNLGPVTCDAANRFAGWARFGVDRAARQILGSRLVKIETMGSYNCRNVAGTSRRSAHATANAIDVSGFVLADGRRISVLGDWNNGTSAERRFLRVIHQSACKRFGVVLGPNYNAAHRDHFHVEAKSGSFCR